MSAQRRDRVAALHKENIVRAAEHLFLERGFEQTTIQEISRLSGYSRRTIYAYFVSKEDILYHVSLQKLLTLQREALEIVESDQGFREKFERFCAAMSEFHAAGIQTFSELGVYSGKEDGEGAPETLADILDCVTLVCTLLAEMIEGGKAQGQVAADVEPAAAAQVLWASISSLLDLVKVGRQLLVPGFTMEQKDFVAYGFHQILNSLLAERSVWTGAETGGES